MVNISNPNFGVHFEQPYCPYFDFMRVYCKNFKWSVGKAVCQSSLDSFSRCCFVPSWVVNGFHEAVLGKDGRLYV